MKEQKLPEAGILEKVAVRGLLWLEKRVEKKPVAKLEQERRWISHPSTRWAAATGTVVVAAAGSLLLLMTIKESYPQYTNLDVPIAIASESNQRPDLSWQLQPDMIAQLAQIKQDKNLILLNSGDLFLNQELFFLQYSKDVIIAIDQKALTQLSEREGRLSQPLALIFTEQSDNQSKVAGVTSLRLPLDYRFREYINRGKVQQLYDDFSTDLSSAVGVAIRATNKYGPQEAIQLLSAPVTDNTVEVQEVRQSFDWYKQQFATRQLRLSIKVVAINPQWTKEKLGQ